MRQLDHPTGAEGFGPCVLLEGATTVMIKSWPALREFL